MTVTALEHIVLVLGLAVEKDAISKYDLRKTLGDLHAELDNAKYLEHIYSRSGAEPEAIWRLNDKISRQYTHVLFPAGLKDEHET